MIFFFIGVALNMAQLLGFILVFLCHFGGIDRSDWIISSTISLVTFVFLGDVDQGLSLRLTCISRKRILARLSLVISMIPTEFILLSEFIAF